jgi:hypothetical protein
MFSLGIGLDSDFMLELGTGKSHQKICLRKINVNGVEWMLQTVNGLLMLAYPETGSAT